MMCVLEHAVHVCGLCMCDMGAERVHIGISGFQQKDLRSGDSSNMATVTVCLCTGARVMSGRGFQVAYVTFCRL